MSKSAEATNEENVFKITLTVDSKDRVVESEEIVGADIVLVFDMSSSMDGSRWDSLKNSANTFIDRMLGSESSGQNRVSIVAYGTYVPYSFNTPITGDVTLYGTWTQLTYKVEFSFVGDIPSDAIVPTAQTGIPYNDKATDPKYSYTNQDASKKVYTFDGWYTKADCAAADKYVFDTPVTENLTLYGKFTAETAKYGYSVEYYLDEEYMGVLDNIADVPYGSEVTADAVQNAYGNSAKEAMSEEKGYPYISFDHAEGITSITADKEQNVAKLYFTTDTFTVTVNYWYYPSGSTTPVKMPDTMIDENPTVQTGLIHGDSYNISSPSVPHYYTKTEAVSGTINGQNVTKDVYYLEHGKFTVTVKYYDIKDKGSEEVASTIASDAVLYTYEDATCNISEELTSGKTITNYTYVETVGETQGISDTATVYVYFSRDTYTVNVKHVDGAEGQPNQAMLEAQNTSESVNVGADYTYEPATNLPENYKQAGAPTITSTGTDVDNPAKGDVITVTYTYVPKGTANPQYTHKSTEGETSGTLAKDEAKVITVKYTLNSYSFTVKYYKDSIADENELTVDPAVTAEAPYGTVLNEEKVSQLLNSEGWLNAQRPSGYNRTNATYVTVGTDPAANVVKVLYTYESTSTGSTDYYDVTVNYYDQDGNVIRSSYTHEDIREGRSWDVTDRQLDTITFEGATYSFDRAEGDPLSGDNIRSNKVIDLYYTVDGTEIEDPDVPGGDLPDQPGTDPGTDPGVDIEDPEVPGGDLPDVPETGDSLMAWVAAAAVSGLGLVWLALTGKKRREDAEG